MATAVQAPTHSPPAPGAGARAGEGARWRVAELNALGAADFAAALGHAVEHAPWVARRAARCRPFRDVRHLLQAMRDTIQRASAQEQLVLLRGHPELAGTEAREGRMTLDSTSEQGRLGLDRLDPDTFKVLQDLNLRYRQRFGFPMVIALRLHSDLKSVLAEAQSRLASEPGDERTRALHQVCEVMTGRVLRLLVAEGPEPTSAFPSTQPPLPTPAPIGRTPSNPEVSS